MTPPQYLDMQILSEPKKWSAIVPSETRHGKDIWTISFRFDFEITAPIEWLEVGFERDLAERFNCSAAEIKRKLKEYFI